MFCINYVVQSKDTLYSISRHFNVDLGMIIQANPFVNVYNLRVGEVLCIPISAPSGDNYDHYTTYLVREGDTLESIINEHHIGLGDLFQLNAMGDFYLLPGSTLHIPITGDGESGVTL